MTILESLIQSVCFGDGTSPDLGFMSQKSFQSGFIIRFLGAYGGPEFRFLGFFLGAQTERELMILDIKVKLSVRG